MTRTPRALASRAWAQGRLALSLVRLRPFDTGTPDGRSKERYRRIALTTVSNLAARGLGSLIGLVTVPLVLGYLGKERFGFWSAVTTLIAWVALFDLGIANGLVNLVSRAHGRDDEDEAGRYVWTAFAFLLAITTALAMVTAVAGPRLPWSSLLAVRGAASDATVNWAVIAALGTFIAGMPLSIVQQVYAGYQRAYWASAFAVLGMMAGFGALLACIHGGADMPALVIALGAGSILAGLLGMAHILATMPWLRPRLSRISVAAARALFERSLPMFLFQLGALAVNETQVILLAHRCDLGVVADYSIVMRVYLLAMGLIQMSTTSFLPSFREASERGDHAWMRASFRQFLRARMFLATPAALVIALFGDALLRIWLRRSDISFPHSVWIALAVTLLASTWVSGHTDLMSIMDRIWVNVALVAINGAVIVGLTYALAPSLKVLGVVLATGFLAVAVYSWLVPWAVRALVLRARG